MREPTIDELAEQLAVDRAKVALWTDLDADVLSLDAPLPEAPELTLGESLRSQGSELGPEDLAERRDLYRAIIETLGGLSERERHILILRFGLLDGDPVTLEQLGHAYGVTRERIRQIEAKALTKLRRLIKRAGSVIE
jgi:RNA polymerase primary sigma factor